jgi:phosphoserine aminotransferase
VRVHNFGAGPAALPLAVLERIREELLDFAGTGASVLEISHRSPAYDRLHNEAIERLHSLLGSSESHDVLFMSGGARTQFSAVPMNLLRSGSQAGYVTTGRWSELALEAGQRVGKVREVWSSQQRSFDIVPRSGDFELDPEFVYLHYTSNNTIFGTQYPETPDVGSVPLVCDMSSDFLSRPLDVRPFGLIYAGAQKNVGPAGVTLVLIRKDLLENASDPGIDTLSYARMAAKNSLLNTPPVFAIYAVARVLEHLENLGGLEAMAERNQAKAKMLYRTIDASSGFYSGHAQPASRSKMNVTFRLPNPDLEAKFIAEAAEEGLMGLKGHRSVGGIRASIYNAIEPRSVEALASFMDEFQHRCG